MKDDNVKYTTPILRYDIRKGEWVRRKDYEYLQNLRFANREFYLVYKNGYYFMCTDRGNDIASVYYKKEVEDGEKIFPGEVVSLFRKNYLKRGITDEMVDLFLDSPPSYDKKYGKK